MSNRVPETLYSIKAANFSAVELPTIKEQRGKEWIYYGAKNLWPQELIELYNTSAMHATAVNAITDAIVGEGFELVGGEYVNLEGETLNELFEKIAKDYELFGGYSLNIIWNKEGNRIAELYHLPFAKVRSGVENEDGDVGEYWFCKDWSNTRKYTPKPYKKFDVTDNKKDNASQIFYFMDYQPGQDYYPLPSYTGALTDIDLDARISRFHNQNLKNGLNPSMFIQFRSGIPTPSERREIYAEIDKTFSSEENAGRFFLSFSRAGEEMTVEPIESANDDYYVTLEQRITSRILTSHRITSPLLLGIKDAAGFSSNAEEIKVAYNHFMGTVVAPKQEKIVKSLGFILKFYGLNVNLTVKPNEILPTVEETIKIEENNDELSDINQ
jgi:hypothetical protein